MSGRLRVRLHLCADPTSKLQPSLDSPGEEGSETLRSHQTKDVCVFPVRSHTSRWEGEAESIRKQGEGKVVEP